MSMCARVCAACVCLCGVCAHVCMRSRTRSYFRSVERVKNEANEVRAAESGCSERNCRVCGCGARVVSEHSQVCICRGVNLPVYLYVVYSTSGYACL